MKTKNLVYLESVGTYIDKDSLNTYAAKTNNKPDYDNPVHIQNVSYEWIENLSKSDFLKVFNK